MKQLPYFAWAAVCKSVAHLCSAPVCLPYDDFGIDIIYE